ncbi:MAG: CBS domain-containing protein [Alphaproteobacteria bacterium]
MRVSNILSLKGRDVFTVVPDTTVAKVVKTLQQKRIGAILVVDAGKIAGIVSERDVTRGLADHGAEVLDMPVSALMTRAVTTCSPDSTIDHIMHMMTESRVRHLPVVERDRLVGFISIGDVVKNRLQELEAEENQLREYVTGSSY